MIFNTIIGNPPYNWGQDLDFIYKSHDISSQVCMIVPAKWQGTDETAIGSSDITYTAFRKEIVPYMEYVVFYPNSQDVFDIAVGGGISYFCLRQTKPEKQYKKTICKTNKHIASDWEEFNTFDIDNLSLYSNTITELVEKCKGHQILLEKFKHTMYVADNKDKIPFSNNSDDIAIISNDSVLGYVKEDDLYTQLGLHKYKVILNCMRGGATDFDSTGKIYGLNKLLVAKSRQVGGGNYYVLKFFDTIDECNSFISYLNTKLIRFLYFLGVYATGIRNATFKFVPEPPNSKYDHIYTDDELYSLYNLTDTEIKIIESIIKDRGDDKIGS